jgi:hypothetical protein
MTGVLVGVEETVEVGVAVEVFARVGVEVFSGVDVAVGVEVTTEVGVAVTSGLWAFKDVTDERLPNPKDRQTVPNTMRNRRETPR